MAEWSGEGDTDYGLGPGVSPTSGNYGMGVDRGSSEPSNWSNEPGVVKAAVDGFKIGFVVGGLVLGGATGVGGILQKRTIGNAMEAALRGAEFGSLFGGTVIGAWTATLAVIGHIMATGVGPGLLHPGEIYVDPDSGMTLIRGQSDKTFKKMRIPASKEAQQSEFAKTVEKAVALMRSKKAITNKHQMLIVGTAIRRMTDKESREFMYDVCGTWNRGVWDQVSKGAKLGQCRAWAREVEAASRRLASGKAKTSNSAQRAAQTWLVQQYNKF